MFRRSFVEVTSELTMFIVIADAVAAAVAVAVAVTGRCQMISTLFLLCQQQLLQVDDTKR